MQGNSNEDIKKYNYTWDNLDTDVVRILRNNPEINNKNFNLIVGVGSGGLSFMVKLSKELEIGYEIIKCHNYDGKKGIELKIDALPNKSKIKEKDILLVDDLCDNGVTLSNAKDKLLEKGAKSIKTVALCYKPHSIYKPDFYAREVLNEEVVIFPWEKDE